LRIDFFYRSVISAFANKLFLLPFSSHHSTQNISFSNSGTSSNLRNQAPLFTELRLLHGTHYGTCTKNLRSDYFTGKRFPKRDFHTTGTGKRLRKWYFLTTGAGKRLPKCENRTSVTGQRSPKCEMATTVAGLSVTVVAFSHFGNRKYIEFDNLGVNRTSFGFYHCCPHGHWATGNVVQQ